MEYRLTTPCTAEDLAPLKAGDTVLLSGVVYTARDQAHKRMTEALEKGEPLPFDLTGSAIYYVGPTPERPGQVPGGISGSKIIYRLCTKRGRLKTGKTADLRRINLVCFNKLPRIACTSAKSVISCTI